MDTKAVIFALLIAVSAFMLFGMGTSDDSLSLYKQWKQKLNVNFDAQEDVYRFKVFEQNLAKINEHNAQVGKTHTEALNQFAFLTQEEFAAQYLSTYEPNKVSDVISEQSEGNGPVVDWVSWGAVSPVKAQGQCQASYAFSTVAALEGLSAIVYKSQQEMSAQQIVDCTQSYGNYGCSSGTMTASFSFVRDRGRNIFN